MLMWSKLWGMAFMPALVYSLFVPTDSPQDTDGPQSGYLPNHNIDPSAIATSLTIAWKQIGNINEVFYAKPLVYTPNNAPNEYVITVSNQNIVRVMDGITGNLISSRTLDPPFMSSDTMCGDIPNTIGITGTPIIDNATDIMYFFSKGYKNQQAGAQGAINGQYKFYAVKLPSLADVTGFPISIEGHYANNDHTRYFVGGTVLNRPGLAMIGNIVVGGFGGHCDNFNYTGMLVAVSKVPGVGVTNIQAMMASPGAPPSSLDITQQLGGKAGIWQSGMGIAADANRVFFVTGNSRGGPGQNLGAAGKPALGNVYLSTLEQAVVHMNVDPNSGLFTQADYFEPHEYDTLNTDVDFGSSGIALLDPNTFYGTGVSRIAVAGGKSGKLYILNANNLGGFSGGSAGSDFVIQTIINANPLLGGAASYPGEGGYIYAAPTGPDYLYCWSFHRDSAGNPSFTLAGKSQITLAGRSIPTVTTNNGAPGTAVVWLTDANRGLVAFNAVPVNGVLVQITLPTTAQTGGLTKNQRAVFGNGRIYIARANSIMMLSGGGITKSPPVTCTPNPVAFGSVMVASTKSVQITCKANTALTKPYCSITSKIFQCGPATFPATVASGASFTFPVVFNLSDAALINYENSSPGPLLPGGAAATLDVYATTGAGFLPDVAIPLTGTVVASGGYLTINQTVVEFGGVYIGGPQASGSITLTNKGSQILNFMGFAWQDALAPGMPYHNITSTVVGNGFASSKFPTVGSTLAAGASIVIPLAFSPISTGTSGSYITFWSDGGYTILSMSGSATAKPSSSSTKPSSTVISKSSSKPSSTSHTGALTTTYKSSSKSSTSSHTGALTTSSKSSSRTLTTTSVTPSGTLNPLEPATIGTFKYIGCYFDLVNNVRSLSSLVYTNATMTLESCAAHCAQYDFFGTEFGDECYCGDTLSPSLRAPETDCISSCVGNTKEVCGTNSRLSVYQNSIYIAPPALPTHVPSAAGYVWQGCYTEATTGRALASKSYTNTSSMTVESCVAFCSSYGYKYAGVEYASQCYCGNTLGAGSVSTSTSSCSKICAGSQSEYCGAGSFLDMYMYNPSTVSSTSKTSTSSTKPTSTKSSTSSTSTSALPYVTPPAVQTRTYTWSVGWVEAAPDGFSRPFVGINGQWPNPAITANIGDTIVITVTNNLVNESTAIHFHGLHQRNTTYADGPAMVTQCPIQPGGSFVYQFQLTQSGTYWYHAHIGGQYIDGFRGPMIITNVNAPYRFDVEQTLTLSDLYHAQAPGLISYYQSADNAENNEGGEPVPNSILINEAQNVRFTIVPGKTYLFHIINMGAFAPQYLQFDQHDMIVVEIDGVYTVPYTVSQLFVAVAQRYSVIIHAKATNAQNFAIKASMSTNMFNPMLIPQTFNTEVSAFLVYNTALKMPAELMITPLPFDDSVFTPYDQMAELGPVTTEIFMTVDFGTNDAGQYRGYLNGVDYIPQKVPTLYTALNAPLSVVKNPAIYGANSNPYVLPFNSVVELTLTNHDDFSHPFHLHGHNFQVVDRGSGGALFPVNPPAGAPMRRDTVMMYAGASVTIRFVADNPGISLFHCHIEWHVEAGLTATFIEAPDVLQSYKPVIPASHKSVCAAQGIAMTGNAAGSTTNYLNLAGANTVPGANPYGALVNPPKTPSTGYPLG